MYLNDKRRPRRRWFVVSLTGALVLVCWWFLAGPSTLFKLQVWLLKHGAWNNIEHWKRHGDWYLPYLVAATSDVTPVPFKAITLPTGPNSFEAYAHYEVDTVSDCVRKTLKSITGKDDGVGLSSFDGVTHTQRMEASRFWNKWYQANKAKLRWNAKEKKFEVIR